MKRNFIKMARIFPVVMAMLAISSMASEAKEAYPNKVIQLVGQFPAGGATDSLARIVAAHLEPLVGEKVIVLNKVGGGGATGTIWVTQQKPDGYTLLYTGRGALTGRIIVEKVPYSYKDFDYIAQTGFIEEVFAVKADASWKTIDEFIDYARRNPGKYLYSSSGPGGMGHIMMETFKDLFKIDVTHVPFKSSAHALTALLGGHVHVCASEGVFEPHFKAKTLRKLFSGSAEGYKTDPNVKNFIDLGHNITVEVWGGLLAPKGTPKEILKKLEADCKKIFADENFKKKMNDVGGGVSSFIDGEGWFKKVDRDYKLFKATLDKLGLSAK